MTLASTLVPQSGSSRNQRPRRRHSRHGSFQVAGAEAVVRAPVKGNYPDAQTEEAGNYLDAQKAGTNLGERTWEGQGYEETQQETVRARETTGTDASSMRQIEAAGEY